MNTPKLLVIALIFAQLSGCATNAPQIPDYFASQSVGPNAVIRKVALVKVLATPEIESVDLGYTRGQGAALGAMRGFDALSQVGCHEASCAALILLLPVFVLTGAIVGAETGYSTDKLKEAETNARARLHSPYLQTQLLDHARDYATDNIDLQFILMPSADPKIISEKPNYAALSAEGFDSVFELELTRLSFDWSVLESLTPSLKMEARARLVSVDTGAVLSDGRYKFTSEARPLKEWTANGAVILTAAIEQGLQTLAEDIVDENFLLFFPILPTQKSPSGPVPLYVLEPFYPVLEHCFFCESPFDKGPHRSIGSLKFVEVTNTQPTFRWERFPQTSTYHISDLRYDIKVFEAGLPSSTKLFLVPTQQVYCERNIPKPYHMIKNKLNPCTDYFWTVRARFKHLGQERVTEWAGAFNVGLWNEKPWNLRRGLNEYKDPLPFLPGIHPDGPEWFYYPFRTPCDQ